MINDVEISEMLLARLCHDLAGPLGALSNGLEFLSTDNPEMRARAMELMDISVTGSLARLQFYRAAFGTVPDSGTANLADFRQLALDFFALGKIRVEWDPAFCAPDSLPISARRTKILLSMMLIASTMLIHGGTITVDFSQYGAIDQQLLLRGEGRDVRTDPEIQSVLFDPSITIPITPRNVHLCYTRRLAEMTKTELQLDVNGDTLTFRASQIS